MKDINMQAETVWVIDNGVSSGHLNPMILSPYLSSGHT